MVSFLTLLASTGAPVSVSVFVTVVNVVAAVVVDATTSHIDAEVIKKAANAVRGFISINVDRV